MRGDAAREVENRTRILTSAYVEDDSQDDKMQEREVRGVNNMLLMSVTASINTVGEKCKTEVGSGL